MNSENGSASISLDTRSKLLPSPLISFLVCSLLLTSAAFATLYFRHFVLHRTNYPDGYLLLPGEPFADIVLYVGRFRYFHSPRFFDANLAGLYLYPPTVAPFYEILYLAHRALIAFLASTLILILSFAGWFGKTLRRLDFSRTSAVLFIGLCLTCSYVLIFEISRANVEIALSSLCIAGMYTAYKDRPIPAAICFGVAGAMKLYPLIFLGLLFRRRRYREFILGLIVCGASTLASLWAICPNLRLSVDGIRRGLRIFTGTYALTFEPITAGADHSLFGLIKQAFSAVSKTAVENTFGSTSHARGQKILGIYMLVLAIGLLWLYFKRMRYLPFINQAICFTCAAVVVPPTSFEYTLLQLYAPWVVLVVISADLWSRDLVSPRGMSAMFICFAAIFSNLAEIQFYGARIEGPLKAILVCALFFLALRYPIEEAKNSIEADSRSLDYQVV